MNIMLLESGGIDHPESRRFNHFQSERNDHLNNNILFQLRTPPLTEPAGSPVLAFADGEDDRNNYIAVPSNTLV